MLFPILNTSIALESVGIATHSDAGSNRRRGLALARSCRRCGLSASVIDVESAFPAPARPIRLDLFLKFVNVSTRRGKLGP